MRLTGKSFEQLRDALLNSFDESRLRSMVRIELEEDLDDIVAQGPLRTRVEDLIRWAEQNGRLPDLLAGALAAVPTNRELAAVELTFLSGGEDDDNNDPLSPSEGVTRQGANQQRQQKILDAAIRSEIPLRRATRLLVLVRDVDSDGLRAVLKIDPKYRLDEENVRSSREFVLYFPVDDDTGALLPADIEIVVIAPDFELETSSQEIKIDPESRNDEVADPVEFMLTPLKTGELHITVEVYQSPPGTQQKVRSKPLTTTCLKTVTRPELFRIVSVPSDVNKDDDPSPGPWPPQLPLPLWFPNVLAIIVGSVLAVGILLSWGDELTGLYERLRPEFQTEGVIAPGIAILFAVLVALYAQHVTGNKHIPKWFKPIPWFALPVSIAIVASLFVVSLSGPITAVSPPTSTTEPLPTATDIVMATPTADPTPRPTTEKPEECTAGGASYYFLDSEGVRRKLTSNELSIVPEKQLMLYIRVYTTSGCEVSFKSWPRLIQSWGELSKKPDPRVAENGYAEFEATYMAPEAPTSFPMLFSLWLAGSPNQRGFSANDLNVVVSDNAQIR